MPAPRTASHRARCTGNQDVGVDVTCGRRMAREAEQHVRVVKRIIVLGARDAILDAERWLSESWWWLVTVPRIARRGGGENRACGSRVLVAPRLAAMISFARDPTISGVIR